MFDKLQRWLIGWWQFLHPEGEYEAQGFEQAATLPDVIYYGLTVIPGHNVLQKGFRLLDQVFIENVWFPPKTSCSTSGGSLWAKTTSGDSVD